MDVSALVNTKPKKSPKRKSLEPGLFHLSILELIPRAPEKITIRELVSKLDVDKVVQSGTYLEEKNYIKKLQRALSQLESKFPEIESEVIGRKNTYCWKASAEPIMFPSLDSNTALVLAMASQYLNPILPDESIKSLNRLFMRANSTLASNSIRTEKIDGISNWRDKVGVLHPGLPREKPAINSKVEAVIYSAVLHERAVKLKYKAWNEKEPSERIISPQGLFIRGQSIYIYAVNHRRIDTKEPIPYLLNRILEAEIISETFHKIPRFNVQKHLDNNPFGVPLEKENLKIPLIIRVDQDALKTLNEQPLSKDQKVGSESDGWSTLTATVNNTIELKQWIMSHGHHMEVVSPAELRKDFKDSIEKLIATYK